jgi:hypothetical protein
MPKFVPVRDLEKPLAEQVHSSKNMQKHRDFDNPYQQKKVDRGWGDNSQIGWGVKGSFGNNDKDEHAQVLKKSTGSNKMVKNEKGLWVKAVAKEKQHSNNDKRINDYSSKNDCDRYSDKNYKDHRDICDSHERQRIRSDSRDRQRYNDRNYKDINYKDRNYRDNDKNYKDHRDICDSHERQRSRSDSRDRQRYNDRNYKDRNYKDRNYRDNDKNYKYHRDISDSHERQRSRSDSRDRKKYNDRNYNDRYHDKTKSEYRNKEIQSLHDIKEDKSISDNNKEEEEEESFFNFSAIQIVNRFQEMYSSNMKGSIRLNEITSLFSDNCIISTLKTGKELISGREKIKKSFSVTVPDISNCMIRLFIEIKINDTVISYCIDYHNQNTTPLGDRSKPTVILYRCQDSMFTNIWGSADPDHLANGM